MIGMLDAVLEMTKVSKKFKRGEIYDSLRDLIPAFAGRLFSNTKGELDANEFWALKDIEFQVNKGGALGIIGPNGAGKSTILKLLCGIIKPTTGNITVRGSLSALIEVGAGFHPDLTGRENIFLNATILGMKREQIKKKFNEIVEFSGLAEFIDTPVKRYSSGMYARLGFSVAAHVEPEILIVDEVLSVGDFAFQTKCIEKMKKLIQESNTVIFVSHNLRAIVEMCNKCILLEQGKIIKEGIPAEVIKYYISPRRESLLEYSKKDISILSANFHNDRAESLQFESGEKAIFEVIISSNINCDNLSLSLTLDDDSHYNVFNSSTERISGKSFSIRAGETKKILFELQLHLAPGIYHAGTYIYRYDIEKEFDAKMNAATIYIKADKDIRGVVNLYPKITIE
jgi:lipopolysaccharide transport system ATP-binding protein